MEPELTASPAANPKKYLRLSDIECYRVSFAPSNQVWEVVGKWPALAQRTVGEQFIRATDSISANIAEGFGRYNKKDKSDFTASPTAPYSNASTGMRKQKLAPCFHPKNISTSLLSFNACPA